MKIFVLVSRQLSCGNADRCSLKSVYNAQFLNNHKDEKKSIYANVFNRYAFSAYCIAGKQD